jgi:hypothetical protein
MREHHPPQREMEPAPCLLARALLSREQPLQLLRTQLFLPLPPPLPPRLCTLRLARVLRTLARSLLEYLHNIYIYT